MNPTADLMKKGLRPRSAGRAVGRIQSNRRPDEEGIETLPFRNVVFPGMNPTADLMKKGLRLAYSVNDVERNKSNRRPDEEGIETDSQADVAVEVEIQPQT